jgi:arrestin-2
MQIAPPIRCQRVPTSIVNKGFSFSQGQVTLEVTLDKDIYYHGERVAARINVTNTSRKSVRNIKVRLPDTG